jgi:glycerophosphoryl diester phosphodiesterase
LTSAELGKADVGAWFSSEFAGTPVPTLEEVFATFGAALYYDVEIKHRHGDPGPVVDAVLDLIGQHRLHGRVLASSFHPAVVSAVRNRHEELPAALIFSAHREVPLALRRGQGRYFCAPDVLKPHWAELERPSAKILGAFDNRPRIVWTVDAGEALDALQGKRYEGIISNDPIAVQNRWVAG